MLSKALLFAGAVILTVVLLTLTAAPTTIRAAQLGSAVELMLKTLRKIDPTIIGVATATYGPKAASSAASEFQAALSKSTGKGGLSRNIPVTVDSCLKMGRLGEVLVAYAALKLRSSTSFATSLDVEVSSTFTPSNVKMVHPTHGTSITYKMLMMHTSTISDINFDASAAQAPTSVGTLAAFVQSYFVDGVGNLNAAIFSASTPGTASAYVPARANTALLSHVLERIIATSAPQYSGLKDYIAREVLEPFGMMSTFWLEVDGSTPGVTPTPSFSGTFTQMSTTSTTVYSKYFDGCIADSTTGTLTIHPAWAADYMGYTTTGDVGRLAHALFIQTSNAVLSSLMQEKLSLDATLTTQLRQGQNGQGLGLNYFNGDIVCGAALATFVITSCPVNNASKIVGFATGQGTSSVGFFCTANVGGATSTTMQVCHAVGIFSGFTRSSHDALFAAAGSAFQESFGTTTLVAITTPSPSGRTRTQGEEDLYSVRVFFGAFMTLIGVVIATYLIQCLLLPPAVATVTDTIGAGDLNIERSPGERPGTTRVTN